MPILALGETSTIVLTNLLSNNHLSNECGSDQLEDFGVGLKFVHLVFHLGQIRLNKLLFQNLQTFTFTINLQIFFFTN